MKRDTVLVVPTIREKQFIEFIESWNKVGLFDHIDLVVVEDNPKRTFSIPNLGICFTHLCWEDIDGQLQDKSWIIPRRSDTVRSFGYYFAWKAGYEYILTLDDDCRPCTAAADGLEYNGEGFIKEHKRNLEGKSRWFNTLNSVKPRGVPFYNIGKNDKVMVNHGLWTNVLDYDAPTQLAAPDKEQFSYDNRIVPAGLYFPFCGMNAMWKRKTTVLMYHLLMGQVINRGPFWNGSISAAKDFTYDLQKLPCDRFGDIWAGLFMKKILDMQGLHVATGMPYIRHDRASNPFTNLKKEANGIEVNEKLWEYVDKFAPVNNASDYYLWGLYKELGLYIEKYDEFPEHQEYFKKLGQAMRVWAELFKESP